MLLHSIIARPVRSRNSLTMLAVTAVMLNLLNTVENEFFRTETAQSCLLGRLHPHDAYFATITCRKMTSLRQNALSLRSLELLRL